MVGAVAYPERSLHLVPDGSIQIRWNLNWLKPSCTCPLLPVGVTSLLVPNLLLFRTVPVLSAKAWPDNQNKHCESHSRCSNTAEFLVPVLRSQSIKLVPIPSTERTLLAFPTIFSIIAVQKAHIETLPTACACTKPSWSSCGSSRNPTIRMRGSPLSRRGAPRGSRPQHQESSRNHRVCGLSDD
jgi:hypothetical protein